jgi:hypothetical protein
MRYEVRNGRHSLTRLIAGGVLVLLAALTLLHSPYWAVISGLIGVTHITSASLGLCPLEAFLHHVLRMPVRVID